MAADRTALAVLASGAAAYAVTVVGASIMHPSWGERNFATTLADVALSLLVFAIFVTLLGMIVLVPLAAILRWLRFDRIWLFVLIYNALFLSPYLLPHLLPKDETFGYSTRDCQSVIKGVTTACGWAMTLQGMALATVVATLAGLVFGYVYHRPVKRRTREVA